MKETINVHMENTLSSLAVTNNDILLPWIWSFIVIITILLIVILILSNRLDYWKMKYMKLISLHQDMYQQHKEKNKKLTSQHIKIALIIIIIAVIIFN